MEKLSWKIFIKASICLFGLWLATTYWPSVIQLAGSLISASTPLIAGLMIAYCVNLLMSFYERQTCFQKMKFSARRALCMTLAMVSFVAIVAGIFGLVIPELTLCLKILFAEIPGFIEKIISNPDIQALLPADITNDLAGLDWKQILDKLAPVLTSGIGTIGSLFSSIFSYTVTLLVSLIFSIYLLLNKETLLSQTDRLLNVYTKEKSYLRLKEVLGIFNDCFEKYLVGQCTEAVILGALCALGMMIFKFPYAVMIGTLIGFTALIPVAGAYIGAAVGAIMILTVSPVQSLLFLIFIVVLQQIEGNLIYPKVVGGSLGLPALWVLAAVTIGGGVMGIPGMLLGVPVSAALYRLIKQDILKKEALKNS